jgi:predicted site-specific integrase-resolvase
MTQTPTAVTPQAALTLNPNDLYDRNSLRNIASETTLIRWEKAGKIKSIALGRKRFYLGSDLLSALQSK